MTNYDTEIVKYTVYYTNARGEAKSKLCTTIEHAHESCKQIKDLGGKVQTVVQIRRVIFYD